MMPYIRNAVETDAADICRIYNHYVQNTWITFEEKDVPEEEMAGRILRTTENYPWLVYEAEGKVLGFIYADRWKQKSSYRYTAETTIYLHNEAGGTGIGTALYEKMLPVLKEMGLRAIVVCIAIPNEGSIGLHEKLGFKKVGIFRESGYKFDTWIDIGYWELLL